MGTLNLQVPVTLSYFIICTVHQHFKLYCSYVINQYNIIPAVIKNRCRQDTGIHHYSTCKVKHNLTYSSKNWVFFSSSGIAPSRPIEVDNDSLSPNHNSGHKLKGHEIFDLKINHLGRCMKRLKQLCGIFRFREDLHEKRMSA